MEEKGGGEGGGGVEMTSGGGQGGPPSSDELPRHPSLIHSESEDVRLPSLSLSLFLYSLSLLTPFVLTRISSLSPFPSNSTWTITTITRSVMC